MNYLIVTKNKFFSSLFSLYFKKIKEGLVVSNSIMDIHYQMKKQKIDVIFIDQDYIKINIPSIVMHIRSHYSKILLFYFNSKNLHTPQSILKTKKDNEEILKLQKNNLYKNDALIIFENFLNTQIEQFKVLSQLPLRKKEITLFFYLYKNMPNSVSIESIIYRLWGTNETKHIKTVYCLSLIQK
jgi:two-component SAPR family response regulator